MGKQKQESKMRILVNAHWSRSDLWLEVSISSSVQPGELYWQSSGKSVDRLFWHLNIKNERGKGISGERLLGPLFRIPGRSFNAIVLCGTTVHASSQILISFQTEGMYGITLVELT